MTALVERLSLGGPPIAQVFVEEFARVKRFYLAGAPSDLESYSRVAETIRTNRPEADWSKLTDLLSLTDGEGRKRLQRLIDERGLFVATGQQAGLFGGPLLTLAKAFTAARLAQSLQGALGVPVVPLFTIASEDHDWREIDHTYVIDVQNVLVRIAVGEPVEEDSSAPHPPIWRMPVGDHIEAALDQLADSTPDTEFKGGVLAPLRDAYATGSSYADAFGQTLRHLLRRYGFVVAPMSDGYVKGASRDLLWKEWEGRRESEVRLLKRATDLEGAGFSAQVPIRKDTTNLFLEGKLGRDRIVYDESGPSLRRSGERITEQELEEVLEDAPERVSPSALLRPVVEGVAFPVVAHVVGPSEVAYLAQSQELYALHEVPAPVVVPRASLQIVEPKISKVLAKYGLSSGDLAGDSSSAISRVIREMAPAELTKSLEQLRTNVSRAFSAVESAAIAFDPESKAALGSGEKAIFDSIGSLERKLEARLREIHQTQKEQLEKAALHLYPNGQPQERVLNVYPYLIRYGESLLDEMYSAVVTPLD